MKTLTLAHYYTIPEVQELADRVGDSLDLAQYASENKADRIVFAGVQFMAETAKLLNPEAEVILPDGNSTCSLVTMTDIQRLKDWVTTWKSKSDKQCIHIAYINSSVQHKAVTDVIVTSRNVEDIVGYYAEKGYRILFSPDRNMGAYLKFKNPDWDIEIWDAVCEVHDKFKIEEVKSIMRGWTDGPKYLIAHPESPLPVLKEADFVGSTSQMLSWIENVPTDISIVYVATEEGLLHIMREMRPKLDIRQAPIYTGCQCNSCPYMKKNTVENVRRSIVTGKGEIITIDRELAAQALKSVEKMLSF